MMKCQMGEIIHVSLKCSSVYTYAEWHSTKRNNFLLICCFTGEELPEESRSTYSTMTYGNKEFALYFSFLFLLRDKKEKKIHGSCFITYTHFDWGERRPHGLPFIPLQKTNQSIKKWAALNLKDTIQNTYLTSYSVALRFYNSLPCAYLLG